MTQARTSSTSGILSAHTIALGAGAALLLLTGAMPARAGASFSGSCAGTGSGVACAGALHYGVVNTYVTRLRSGPPDEQEIEARERAWSERCRPSLVYDRYGVGRYVYAANGCELGRFQD
jgi:hypothetical protein